MMRSVIYIIILMSFQFKTHIIKLRYPANVTQSIYGNNSNAAGFDIRPNMMAVASIRPQRITSHIKAAGYASRLKKIVNGK